MLKIACPYHLLIWQKMFLPVFFCFFESFLWVLLLSLSVCKTQNMITMELNKQLWSGFLYVMPYSIFFALIKTSVLPVHFSQTDDFLWFAVHTTWSERIKLLNKIFHEPLCTFSSIVWRLTNSNLSMFK